MNYSDYALIDLHLHLDGSLSPESVAEMARMSKVVLPAYDCDVIASKLKCPRNCTDLNTYLKCFELPVSVLQTDETIEFAVYDLLKRISAQGIVCAEVRFAPQLHTLRGLTQKEIIMSAVRGVQKAETETGIAAGLILCCMRGDSNHKDNEETIRLVSELRGEYVVGCDLAGAEAVFPTENFRKLFETAAGNGIPFTVHAGEAAGTDSIESALSFGASRIGHGIRAFRSDHLLRELCCKKTVLELCPTSNMDTHAIEGISDISEYPIGRFFEYNVSVTINTDDMTVSDTTLKDEYRKLFENGLITHEQARQTVYTALNASFIPDFKKASVLEKIRSVTG